MQHSMRYGFRRTQRLPMLCGMSAAYSARRTSLHRSVGILLIRVSMSCTSADTHRMDSGNVRASESTCRSCYTKLFAIGTCVACTKPIVGDREEGHRGAHVKGRGTSMWHAACFRCSCTYTYEEARADESVCQGSLYRQDHLLTPSGKPACVSCFEKSLHSPPLQLPAAPGPANSKRSYARPRSMLGPAQGASPAPSRPKLATKELVTTPHRPRIGAGSIEGVGSVRKLAARFDANNPPEERSTRLRDMKQSIAELDRHLGQAR